ncbi:MAG: energy-coupling factor transporter ATPase [Firmicutes bacterium]|jgi:energy-coupling factor transport system ATP-binding protein|nr:energy-coupling factor transporter ATPase [Bacillota bacterium]
MAAMFQLEQVSHLYNGGDTEQKIALKDVNLAIAPGEFVAVIGHNGSGKSTLAKHLNALLLPTEGQVLVKGMDTKDPEQLWSIRQTAGMVFQNPDNQIVATAVEEDVAFGPENLGVPPADIRRRVEAALKAVDMWEFRQAAPHLLSGGQKQRIAIAGVLAMHPEALILDEPTAMLDPSGRREVMDTVVRLNREEGITVVHITHFMEEAVLASRVIVMNDGQIVLDGVPEEVFSHVTELKALGLDVPQVTELALRLSEHNVKLPPGILTVERMVTELCQLKSKM